MTRPPLVPSLDDDVDDSFGVMANVSARYLPMSGRPNSRVTGPAGDRLMLGVGTADERFSFIFCKIAGEWRGAAERKGKTEGE